MMTSYQHTNHESLGDAYPKQQERCRKILVQYIQIGQAGAFGRALLEDLLRRADRAAIEQDLPAMIRCYKEMQDFE